MSDDTNQMQDPAVEQIAPAPQAPSLQLTDLVLALQTIQAAATRGAIRADEMTAIGGLHDRLFAFLEAQGVITRKAPEQTGAQNA